MKTAFLLSTWRIDLFRLFQNHALLRPLLAAVCLALLMSATAPALLAEDGKAKPAADAKSPGGLSDLDSQLLEGLEEELLPGLDDPLPAAGGEKGPPSVKTDGDQGATGPSPAEAKPTIEPALSPEDEALLRSLEGEGLQGESGQDPLTRVGNKMRRVERLIAEGDISQETRSRQQEIVRQLDTLIEQIKRNKKSSAQSQASPGGSRRTSVGQPNRPSQQPGEQTARKPARDSTDRIGQEAEQEVDQAAIQAMMKRIWGRLPQRQREEMIQLSADQFLPKYATEIEKYFRRLAEEDERRGE